MTALKPIIEALLFGSEAPLSLKEICHIIEEVNDPSDGQQMLWQAADISRTLSEMVAEYATGPQGFYLAQVAGAYQFRTKPAYAPFLRSLCKEKPYRISRSAMEVLSIVAYRQPVTRAEIDEVRGVDSSAGLRTLLERGLVRSLGHSEHVGHPSLFGTTPLFLEVFNLNALEELPPMATPALVAPGASGSSTPAGSLAAEPAGATDADAAALAVLESTPSADAAALEALFTDQFTRIAEEMEADQQLVQELDSEVERLGDVQERVLAVAFSQAPVSEAVSPSTDRSSDAAPGHAPRLSDESTAAS